MAATVFTNKVKGPATHALVIGVGHYPHLPGGAAKKKFAKPDGMGQLKSPPESARAVARWLIAKYECPNRPLGSVALLTSEKLATKFEFQPREKNKGKKSVSTTLASMPEVAKAILDWRAIGNKNPEHLLLFFFCGHGVSAGTELALLMSDFGEKEPAPLDGALDFRRFHSNMDECAARHQCYFIDACRVGSQLLQRNAGFAGNPVVQWTGTGVNPNGQLRLGPIFYSTLAQAQAYAQPGEPSIFTKALLESLGGAGSGDESGPWEVRTTRLSEALNFIMREAGEELKMPQEQISPSDNLVPFTLNTLDYPKVPVVVRVDPLTAHAKAALRCESTVLQQKRPPNKEPWRFSVAAGKYSFFADFKKNEFKADPIIDDIVRPPYWGKRLKAKP